MTSSIHLCVAAVPTEDNFERLLGSAVQDRDSRSPRSKGGPSVSHPRRRVSHCQAADRVAAERGGQPLQPTDVDARLVLQIASILKRNC